MNYPIKHTDLSRGLATNDEQATLVVVEAILDGVYQDIEFVDEAKRAAIENDVKNWPRFEEYSMLISSQKTLLNRPFAAEMLAANPDEADVDLIMQASRIAEKTSLQFISEQKSASRMKLFSAVAVAAVVAFLFIGVTSIISNQSSGTKSSSIRTSSNLSSDSDQSSTGAESKPETQNEVRETRVASDPEQGISPDSMSSETTPNKIQNNPNPIKTDVNTSSSETKITENSTFALLIAFGLAALLFLIAATFFKRRKNRNLS